MEPIFDKIGRVVGWLEEDVIYDLHGRPRAFVEEQEVYTYQAKHLGIFEDGFFRDKNGAAVGFVEEAKDGPITPITQIPPIEPITAIEPIRPITPIPPISPLNSLSWSKKSWNSYLTGE